MFLESVQSFAIESTGHKLIVITGENLRTNVTFYKMGQGQKSGKIEVLSSYCSPAGRRDEFSRMFLSFTEVLAQPVTTAIWSPNGQYVLLAAMKTR